MYVRTLFHNPILFISFTALFCYCCGCVTSHQTNLVWFSKPKKEGVYCIEISPNIKEKLSNYFIFLYPIPLLFLLSFFPPLLFPYPFTSSLVKHSWVIKYKKCCFLGLYDVCWTTAAATTTAAAATAPRAAQEAAPAAASTAAARDGEKATLDFSSAEHQQVALTKWFRD